MSNPKSTGAVGGEDAKGWESQSNGEVPVASAEAVGSCCHENRRRRLSVVSGKDQETL